MTQRIIQNSTLPSKSKGHRLKAIEFNYLNDVINDNSIDMEERLGSIGDSDLNNRLTNLESLSNNIGLYESYNLPSGVVNGYLAYDKLLSTLAYHKDGNWYRVSNNEFIYVDQIVFKIDTTKPGTPSDTFSLLVGEPLRASDVYDFNISWGDGTTNDITDNTDPALTHVYDVPGIKTVTIRGIFNGFDWFDHNQTTTDKDKLLDIISWGNYTTVGSAYGSFYNCSNLDVSATNSPNMGDVTSLFFFFGECSQLKYAPEMDTSSCVEWFGAFVACNALISLPNYNFDATTSVNGLRITFKNCYNLEKLPDTLASDALSGDNGFKGFRTAFTNCTSITTIPEINFSQGVDCRQLFQGCTNLTYINFIPDFSSANNLTNAWENCNLTAESIKNVLQGLVNSNIYNLSTSFAGGGNAGHNTWDDTAKTNLNTLTNDRGWTISYNN